MALNITGLKRDVILQKALIAFKKKLCGLGLFSTVLKDVPLEGTDKVQVSYYPTETAVSKDYKDATGYEGGNGYVSSKDVTIDKRKYQALSLTSKEKARNPNINFEQLVMMKVNKLADDVWSDVLSLVKAAKFGSAFAAPVAIENFDGDSIIDLRVALNQKNFPQSPRGLILDFLAEGNILKDLKAAGGIGNVGFSPLANGLPNVLGFDIATVNVPDNGENLYGFAVNPAAILFAQAPIAPADDGKVVEYKVFTDPETGLSLEYRKWFEPGMDRAQEIIECNYGYDIGDDKALLRITKA